MRGDVRRYDTDVRPNQFCAASLSALLGIWRSSAGELSRASCQFPPSFQSINSRTRRIRVNSRDPEILIVDKKVKRKFTVSNGFVRKRSDGIEFHLNPF